MALTELIETWAGRNGEFRGEFRPQDLIEVRTYTRTFQAQVDDATVSFPDLYALILADARYVGLFPAQGAAYPSDPAYRARRYRFSVPYASTPNFVTIDVTYELWYNPLHEPPLVELDSNQYEFTVRKVYFPHPLSDLYALNSITDAQGNYILCNSALDAFDPVPTRQEPYALLRVALNLATFDPNAFQTNYVLKINSQDFFVKWQVDLSTTVYPAGTVLLDTPPRVTQEERDGTRYFRIYLAFKIRTVYPYWLLSIGDFGLRYFDFVQGTQVQIFDQVGNPATNPRKLDGLGQEATPFSPITWLDYRQYAQTNFNDLDLFHNVGLVPDFGP